MYQNQTNDSWNHVRQRVKSAWGKLSTDDCKKAWERLTDDDFKKAEGSIDQLYRVILEKFGDTTDAIKAKLDQGMSQASKM
ncbi:MAG: CsbD family protein [Deltaproteobacteria bacterium]|nr:CsbD family protein [Deltaproteobacteria bacterium]